MAYAKELIPVINLDKELIDLEKRLDKENYIPTKRDMMILNIRKKLSSAEALEPGESPLTTAEFAFYYGMSRPRVDQLGRDVITHARKDVMKKAQDPAYRESLPDAVKDRIKGGKLLDVPIELPEEMMEDFNKLAGINEQSDEDYAKAGKLADYYHEVEEVGPITDEFVLAWADRYEVDLGDKANTIKKIANEIVGFKHDEEEIEEALGEIGEIETEKKDHTNKICPSCKCPEYTDENGKCIKCGADCVDPGELIDAAELQIGNREESESQLMMDFKKLTEVDKHYAGDMKYPEEKEEIYCPNCDKMTTNYSGEGENLICNDCEANPYDTPQKEGVMKTLATRKMYQDREEGWGSGEPQMRPWFKKCLKNKPMSRSQYRKHVEGNDETGMPSPAVEEGEIGVGYIQKEPVPPGPKSPKPGNSLINEQPELSAAEIAKQYNELAGQVDQGDWDDEFLNPWMEVAFDNQTIRFEYKSITNTTSGQIGNAPHNKVVKYITVAQALEELNNLKGQNEQTSELNESLSRYQWDKVKEAVSDIIRNFKKITKIDGYKIIDPEGQFYQDMIDKTQSEIFPYLQEKHPELWADKQALDEFFYSLDDALMTAFADEAIEKAAGRGEEQLDEQTPTLPQQPGTPTAQPTAEPISFNPNDKVSVNGIPANDPVNKYNNKAGIVISSGPEGTTVRLDSGMGDVKFNSPQYLKKV